MELRVPDVSIIIVNYYTSSQIEDCVASVRKYTSGLLYEFIIVDNNTEPYLKEKYSKEKDVTVILLDENVGFGRANNEGFKCAKGRYIFCLNPDTILLNNALYVLTSFMDSHPDAGACGGNLYDAECNPALSYRRFLPGWKWEIDLLLNRRLEKRIYGENTIFNHSQFPIEVGYITGADLMIRKEIIDQTGGFNPAFFMYYEETDLCRRLHRLGWRIYSVPEAKIMHLEGTSFGDKAGVNKSQLERSERGMRTYYRINFKQPKRLFLQSVYLITLLSRSLLLRRGVKREKWRFKLKLFFQL